MKKGTVKWYDQTKGYGFVASEGQEYFMHASSILSEDDKLAMEKGMEVEFMIQKGKKGFQTDKVSIIH